MAAASAVAQAAPGPAAAKEPPAPPVLTGDLLETSFDTGLTRVRGSCRWREGDTLITADQFDYDRKADVLTATGHVVLTRGVGRLLADWVKYQHKDGFFRARNVRLGRYPIYMQGATAEGTAKEIVLHQATMTYTDPGRWKPSAKADTIIYSPGRYVKMVGSLIGITGVEVIPIKGLQQDLTQALTAEYFHFEGGYRSSLGGILDVGFHVPVFDTARLGGDLSFYTKRGLMLGPSGTYGAPDGSGEVSGFLRSGLIHDYGVRIKDVLGNAISHDRGFAEWRHNQQLADNLTLSADINWWTDSNVLRDFRPKEFYPMQQPDNTIEAVYTGANYFASAFARLQPETFEPVQERLPELRFDLMPTAVGAGFNERFEASAASLLERSQTGGPTLAENRLDAFYGLSRPFAPVDWFTFTPVAGGRITDYSDTRGAAAPGGYVRALGELGFDSVLRSSGTFNYRNPVWEIDGLRHLVTPTLTYRYIPEADKGSNYIPPIDRPSFSTYLQPLELADLRSVDRLHATNTLRLGLGNILQTRESGYGSRDLASLDIADDLNFRRSPGDPDFSDFHARFTLTPARWIEIYSDQIYYARTFSLRQFTSGLILRDGQAWSVQVASNFLRHENDDYLLNVQVRINEQFSGLFLLEYGARQHRFNQQVIGIEQNLANTWRVQYLVTASNGPNPEGHFGFQVNIEAIRF